MPRREAERSAIVRAENHGKSVAYVQLSCELGCAKRASLQLQNGC